MRKLAWIVLLGSLSIISCAEGDEVTPQPSMSSGGTGGEDASVGGTGGGGAGDAGSEGGSDAGTGGADAGGTGGDGGAGGSTAGAGGDGGAGGSTAGSGGDGGAGGSTGGTGGDGGTGGSTGGAGGSTGGTGGVGGIGGSTGGTGGDGGTGGSGGATGYSHTIAIDGTNDFSAADTVATTTGSFTGYVSWDDTYLFLGMKGSDVASNDQYKWILIYIGGNPGTTTGQVYRDQEPVLPFDARWHVRWKANNAQTLAFVFNGTWTDASWDFTDDVVQSGDFFEMRIPLADIGSPTLVKVHMSMINEAWGGGDQWTWAGVPAGSFTDGTDPNYTKYYEFDLQDSKTPSQYLALP